MNAEGFGQHLDNLRPALKEYGKFVVERITSYLKSNITPQEYNQLFKVPPSARVKDTASAVEKVARKKYQDPVGQMTDVIGSRFVVLMQADLEIIEKSVLNCNAWTARKDRTPLFEIEENPEVFEYQSIHFIVKLNEELKINDLTIPRDTPCEIQIRTLMQHAYAEFVHDRVYKGEKKIPSNVRRLVARAMAMLETTDEIFTEAAAELASLNLDIDAWHSEATAIYLAHCGSITSKVSTEESRLFYETFHFLLSAANKNDVRALFSAYASKIIELKEEQNIFSHPIVVPLLWLLKNHDQETAAKWWLGKYRNDLETVAAVLGIGLIGK
ncbi:GTP pyrophosphokinase [Variovorax sp. W2I14]|uniref:GTP pyrophosphokinase n=1 Tax=Variovorax sp. W2I14 TaxID=3042290 RepID=UPI003D2033F1